MTLPNVAVPTDTLKKINELYFKSGYMDKYGKDVWISGILCIVFLFITFQQHITNVLEVVRSDWPNQKCNPAFMPFAGFIMKPKNQSNLEFTVNNFSGCITSILEFVALAAIQPFRIILQVLNEAIQALLDSFNMLRGMMDKMRKDYAGIFDLIYAGISNLLVAFMNFVVKMKDIMEKSKGLITTILFTLFGAYMTIESLFLAMIDLCVKILIIIAAIALTFIYLTVVFFPLPLIGPGMAVGPAITAAMIVMIFIAILIPVVWFMIMMMRVLRLSSPPAPKTPSCFAGDTLIPLFAGGARKIKDIQLGDRLKNGGLVTATMQFSATAQNLYHLNGVNVTGEHRVFHPTLDWLKVKNHPDSVYLPDFTEPYVYCLNTTDKVFVIGDTLFSDWDDIDTKVLGSLQEQCVSKGYLPDHFTHADIHTYLESGLHPDTLISLPDGTSVPIQEIRINDRVAENTKVLGVIKIQGGDVDLYKHTFANGASLCGTKNIHIADSNLGIVNCMQGESMQSESMQSESIKLSDSTTPILYHLLTDTKFFKANQLKINDYNFGIDAYLMDI
jgi:hypothetical protein